MGSSIALSDLTISSCERLDKSCWTSIVRAISNQDSAGESLTSIANVPYLEVKGVFELRRMVGVATRGCLTLSTQALRRWGYQDAASPCFRLNPGQVLWPSYSRHLGRDAFRPHPQTPCRRCCLMRGCMMPGHLRRPEGGYVLLFALSCHDPGGRGISSGPRSCRSNQLRLPDTPIVVE